MIIPKSLLLITTLLLSFTVFGSSVFGASVGGGRDFDDNAVIRGGCLSTQECQQKYQAAGSGVVGIFNHFGLSAQEMNGLDSTAVVGQVNSNNEVIVNGRVVATDAMTAGRQNIPGSTEVMAGGVKFYKRPPSVSFASSPLPAFVVMKDGQFQHAILARCGNPVTAKPVKPEVTRAPVKIVKIAKDTAGRQLSAVPTNIFIFDVTCGGQTSSVTYNQTPTTAGNCPIGQTVIITERPSSGWQIMGPASQSFSVGRQGVRAVFENQQQPPAQVQGAVTPPAPAPAAAPAPAPQALPRAGAQNVVSIGLAAAIVSGLTHYLYSRRFL